MNLSTEDLREIQEFDRRVVASLVLWLTLAEEQPNVWLTKEFREIQQWLVGFPHIMHEVNARNAHENEVLWIPPWRAPDICTECYRHLGYVLSGRLQNGCYICGIQGDFLKYPISQFRDILFISNKHIEYLFARALYLWTTIQFPHGKVECQS